MPTLPFEWSAALASLALLALAAALHQQRLTRRLAAARVFPCRALTARALTTRAPRPPEGPGRMLVSSRPPQSPLEPAGADQAGLEADLHRQLEAANRRTVDLLAVLRQARERIRKADQAEAHALHERRAQADALDSARTREMAQMAARQEILAAELQQARQEIEQHKQTSRMLKTALRQAGTVGDSHRKQAEALAARAAAWEAQAAELQASLGAAHAALKEAISERDAARIAPLEKAQGSKPADPSRGAWEREKSAAREAIALIKPAPDPVQPAPPAPTPASAPPAPGKKPAATWSKPLHADPEWSTLGEPCAHLGQDTDPDTRLAYASPANYCYFVDPAAPISARHQTSHCLGSQHIHCHIFNGARHPPGALIDDKPDDPPPRSGLGQRLTSILRDK